MALEKKNTINMKIGDKFVFVVDGIDSYVVVAYGPMFFGWETVSKDRRGISNHRDVFAFPPKKKVGDFKVGDKFKLLNAYAQFTYEVTAVGETTSLAKVNNGTEYPVQHSSSAVEVKND